MREQPLSFGAQEFSSSGSVNLTVQGTQSDIRIIPAKILKALLLIIFVLFALHLASLVMKFGFDAVTGYGFITLFDLNTEANIPTYLSSASLAFAISTRVEKTLELLGLALFVYALTDYAARQRNVWRFSFRERPG
jgi:hypothetical protein